MPDELTTTQPRPDGNWSAGSLRITSRTVTAREVSTRLGIEPHRQFEQGSLSSPRNPASHRRETAVWILESGLGNDRSLDEHTEALLNRLDGKHEALSGLAAACDLELSLGFGSETGQGGCVLPARLLKELGTLGLDLVLDLYPPTPEAD